MSRLLVAVSLLSLLATPAFAKSAKPKDHPSVSLIGAFDDMEKSLQTALALLQGREPSKKQVEAAIELLQTVQKSLADVRNDAKRWAALDKESDSKCEPCAKCEPCPVTPDKPGGPDKLGPPGRCVSCPKCVVCAECERCDTYDKKDKHDKHDKHDKCERFDKHGHCIDGPNKLPPAPAPMAPDAFQALTTQVSNEAFEEGKLTVLATAAKYGFFMVEQVKVLMELFPFSSGKLSALALVQPCILDMDKAFLLYESFAFESDKKKAKEILERGE